MASDTDAVLITGAGSGIGRATALRFAGDGAHVVVTDVTTSGGEETVEQVEDSGGSAEFRQLDVTDYDAVESVVEAVDDEHGLDTLVNNAGVGSPPRPLAETGTDVRDFIVEVNAKGVWNGCRAAVPVMEEGGDGGSVVNVSSLAGVTGAPTIATYSMSKGAVVSLTESVAAEVGPAGIRVNAVCPGFVETAMLEEYLGAADDREAARERLASDYPLGRVGQPAEIADAIAFLAGDRAAWITGQALVVDGGYSCY